MFHMKLIIKSIDKFIILKFIYYYYLVLFKFENLTFRNLLYQNKFIISVSIYYSV